MKLPRFWTHRKGRSTSVPGPSRHLLRCKRMSASLIGRLGSSAFRLFTATVSMSLTGSCFSSESAPGPFHYGVRRRGGTIFRAILPSDERQIQADMRTHLFDRPARDIIPPLGGARVSSYRSDPRRFSCCCGLFPGPAELGAVNPNAMHDHGQPAPGDLHRPALSQDHFFERSML